MGWVKQPVINSCDVCDEIVSKFTEESLVRSANRDGCGSVYEYLSDYIRDYYDVTLTQCHDIAVKVSETLGIKKLYYGD